MTRATPLLVLLLLAGCSPLVPLGTPPAMDVVCGVDPCRELFVDGDSPANFAGVPAPFRGYGDPSI